MDINMSNLKFEKKADNWVYLKVNNLAENDIKYSTMIGIL